MKRTVSLMLLLALLLGLGGVALAGPTGATPEEIAVYNGNGNKQNGMPTLARAVLGEQAGTTFAGTMLASGTVAGGLKAAASNDPTPVPPDPAKSSLTLSMDWSTFSFSLTYSYDITENGDGKITLTSVGGHTPLNIMTNMSPGVSGTELFERYVQNTSTAITVTLYDGNGISLSTQTSTRPPSVI